ncbi:MAG: PqqD family protein [Eubacterium sp.]
MKIKSGFAKREIAGSNIVVPVGRKSREFNGMITLNDSGSFFWDCFCSDITVDEVVKKVTDEYDVDEGTARRDIEGFVKMLRENDLLDE